MGLHVPVCVGIPGVVVLGASDLDLLETPLGQVGVAGSQIATKRCVLETERRGESADSATVSRSSIANDFNLPVVLVVTNSQVTVGRHLIILLPHGGSDRVGVEVATSLGMDQADNGAVTQISELVGLGVIIRLVAVRVKEPIIVGVLVVIAGNLLLLGTFGVSLDVGMEETTAIAHVLDCGAGPVSDLKRAILANLSSLEVGLEERAHLSIARAGPVENGEVQSKGEEVDEEWDQNQAHNTGTEMDNELGL